jgi:hypothetical protein
MRCAARYIAAMLQIPGAALLDKVTLVGGCVRLPLRVDAMQLRAEVEALPAALWNGSGGRIGVHRAAEALFLRGYAPAEGERPIEPRAPLALLPYVQWIIQDLVPAAPMRCLLARLPGGATIAPHIDRAAYFSQTLRVHVPVSSHARAWMIAGTLSYLMAPGEVWVLNNTSPHAVWNEDTLLARTHLICDFLPSPALLALLAAGERGCGQHCEHVLAHLAARASLPVAEGG